MWKYDGTYTIKANYGSAEKSNSAQVELTGGVAYGHQHTTTPEHQQTMWFKPSCCRWSMCTIYSISGGMVTGANINTNDNSIVINIDALVMMEH